MSGLQELSRVRLGSRERQILRDAPSRPVLSAGALDERREKLLSLGSDLARVGNGSGVDLVVTHLDAQPEVDHDRLLALTWDTQSERVALHRAARRLFDHGLIEYWTVQRQREGSWRRTICVCLTALGEEVVKRYGLELRSGGRIRWGPKR